MSERIQQVKKEIRDKDLDPPFREVLESSGFKEGIKVLRSNPGKVVRTKFLFSRMPERHGEQIRDIKRSMDMFSTLHRHYGIALPKADLIIGMEDGLKKCFFVVDRIQGKNLSEMGLVPFEAEPKLIAFYAGLAKHYVDTAYRGGDYWNDSGNHQIVWGHPIGKEENDIYLVDLDQSYTEYTKGKSGNMRLLREFRDVIFEMIDVGSKFASTARFSELKNFLITIEAVWRN